MAEILVKPDQLRQAAHDIVEHSRKLQDALNAVDAEIQSIGIGRFDGERANSLRTRYKRLQEQINHIKPLLDYFAQNLDNAAARFMAADQA
jgi:WXG100 family type VII secretion target